MRMGNRLAGFACVLVTACVSPSGDHAAPRIAVGGDSPLVELLTRVGAESGVPAELLAAIAHVETRFRIVHGDPHGSGALGLLGLPPAAIDHGAALAGVSNDAARSEPEAGLRAGAALLREAAPNARSVDDFLAVLAPELRLEVTAALARGVDGRDAAGRSIVIGARAGAPAGLGTVTQALGYPGATWNAASSQNYQSASRGLPDIDHVVIHTTEGSFSGTIGWFQNPDAQVSAHYVVRSSDGFITQMVSEQNIAWHDKCFNTRTVGIEHEGHVNNPDLWYTETMYAESAKLTAYLCDKYGIAKEYGPIIGHDSAPDCSDHSDPGVGWDWNHYIDLVTTGGAPNFDASDVTIDAPATMISGDRATVVVTITNGGSSAWDLEITRLGTTAPQDRESAFFTSGDWLSPNRATSPDVRVEPGATGTFTFDIIAPDVTEPTVFDEAFQLVEEGVTWFGPDVHMMTQVLPRNVDGDGDGNGDDGEHGGCSAGGAGSGGMACVMLALGVTLRSRRRRTAVRL